MNSESQKIINYKKLTEKVEIPRFSVPMLLIPQDWLQVMGKGRVTDVDP